MYHHRRTVVYGGGPSIGMGFGPVYHHRSDPFVTAWAVGSLFGHAVHLGGYALSGVTSLSSGAMFFKGAVAAIAGLCLMATGGGLGMVLGGVLCLAGVMAIGKAVSDPSPNVINPNAYGHQQHVYTV